MPEIRLPITDYYDPDPSVADKTYQKKAAVLDGYKFDWLDRKIPKSTYESTDIVHWLALDTALQALADARIHSDNILRETTGVVLGNTLTGEFTRSNHMLLRWPYVKKALRASLRKKGLSHIQDGLEITMERYYKSVFAPVTEDTLAGGLANTIAGRVCNYLDIHGGGYIVDGACSSSLLAITSAANYLELGQMDMVIAGGVDISLDTFELIGFAKTGALTRDEMRVYDKQGKGFIPGEGCGVVVLKRLDDAIRDNDQVYAVLKGWGIASDGKGGITAPSAVGQSRALKRAYQKANFNPDNLNFIEGHGTGTTVGDKVELEGISIAISSETQKDLRSCGVTSLKSIVGHTKAAAGVGAFIKTVIALNRRIIPPTAGLKELNPIFEDKAKKIYPVLYGRALDSTTTMFAGVSAMGFGGINSHVLLQSGDAPADNFQPALEERKLMVSNQTHELLLFAAPDYESLADEVIRAIELSKGISYGELADFACYWNSKTDFKGKFRAAVVTTDPFELERKLQDLLKNLNNSKGDKPISLEGGTIVVGRKKENLRIGGLYPGQGSQRINMAYKLVERFDWAQQLVTHAEELFNQIGTAEVSNSIYRPMDRVLDNAQENKWKDALRQTNIAQPAITLASLLWHKYLKRLGIDVSVATGHSLGELMAFHAAGFFDEDTLLQFAAFRGKTMANCGSGTMASLVCPKEQAEKYIKQAPGYVAIANINANDQTVISGENDSIEYIIKLAEADHIGAVRLPVSAAFHSKLIGDAANAIKKFDPLRKSQGGSDTTTLISSVTGKKVDKNINLNDYFADQCIKQVSFIDTINTMKNECDVMVEIGSGKILAGLSENIQNDVKGFPVEARPNEEQSLNTMLANIFVMGASINIQELYADRLIRDFVPASQKEFIVNPCERPFPEIEDDGFVSETGDNSAILMQSLNLTGDAFSEYMKIRGGFVRDMIQTDMRHFQPTGHSIPVGSYAKLANQSFPVAKAQVTNTGSTGNIKDVLFKKIETITGFPSENFKESMKLLDDFNLDSIKAGSVLNDIFKSLQIVGKINPSNFLNASLETIRMEIEKVLGPVTGATTGAGTNSKEEIEHFVYNLLAEKTGFPKEGLQPGFRLLNDLNLDSIKAGSLLGQLVKKYNLQGKIEVAAHANASIAEIINKIAELVPSGTGTASIPGISSSKADIQTYVFSQIEEKTGFPLSSINPEFKLLDDLNLDSIKANSFIAGLLKLYGLQGKMEPVKFSNASLANIIDQISSLLGSTANTEVITPEEKSSGGKVNSYVVNLWQEQLSVSANIVKEYWNSRKTAIVTTSDNLEFARNLQKGLGSAEIFDYKDIAGKADKFQSMIALLPTCDSTAKYAEVVALLSAISHCSAAILSDIGFVQFGNGSFARNPEDKSKIPYYSAVAFTASLHLERPGVKFRALEFDPNTKTDLIAKAIQEEFSTEPAFLAAGYDKNGQRRRMGYELTENIASKSSGIELTEADVVLVTGGAKGITAECAITFARKYKCRMALVGTSAYNGEDGEIKNILERYTAEGLKAGYFPCNITNEESTKVLLKKITAELGKVTGVIHGAGKNVPRRSETVSLEQALDEISPKINGAIHIINALNPKDLKCVVAFSSIIGVTGMAGNSWYAFSNETLDLFLRNLHQAYGVKTVALAYSIWSEVGMGERMGSTHALARMGIGAIHPTDGINQFMKWVENKSCDQQIVIASALGGLDTWVRKPYPKPEASRYLQDITLFEPGIELKVRSRISQETDVYIDDHNYKGSLLFPTVFGLEAMAQAAALITNIPAPKAIKLEDISLTKPIVVPQSGETESGETEIEVHATVLDPDPSSPELKRVNVGISTEHSGFTDYHFSATFTLGGEPSKEILSIEAKKPLPIIPKSDLYGSLLFQGPRFQLMDKLFSVSNKRAVFATAKLSNDTSDQCFSVSVKKPLLLGSPLLRDTLLQSVQLMLTHKIVLPIGIERWEINNPEHQPEGGMVECTLTQWDEKIGLCDVVYVNGKAEVMEKIHGYRVKAMEPYDGYPSPAELNEVETYIESRILDGFAAIESFTDDKTDLIVYKHDADFSSINQAERRKLEQEVFDNYANTRSDKKDFANQKLVWADNGKPGFNKDGLQISISHSKSILLMSVGQTAQGCDIEIVTSRSEEEWRGILDPNISKAIDALKDINIEYNQACTMLWGAQEACIKALGDTPDSLNIQRVEGNGVMLRISVKNNTVNLYTFPVTLYPGTTFVVTVLVTLKKEAPVLKAQPESKSEIQYNIDDIFDPKAGKFVTQFFTAFKDCRGFHAKTYFVNFPFWMGNLREYILTPVKKQLLKDLGSGEFGMVTNNSTVHIYDEAETLDKITGRLWITEKSDLKNSLIDLGYEWIKHTEDGKLVKIGECELSTTWVKIEERGIVKLSPIPEYFYKFLDEHIRNGQSNDVTLQPANYPTFTDLGKLLYKSATIPRPSVVLNKRTYHTGLYNANTVGNLYYSNYYDWQAKNIESYLFKLVPETYLQSGRAGEYICLETNVNHLQEAMPFEDIETVMYLEQLYDNGVKLYFEYYALGDGSKRKLSYGYNYLIWAKRRNEEEAPVATQLPEKLKEALTQSIASASNILV